MNIYIIYLLVFIFGLVIGSFLNALVWRLYKSESLWKRARSYCVECGKNLQARDLIPILSFIFLGGKCRYCRKKISWQYPLIELATGIFFVLVFNKYWILSPFWRSPVGGDIGYWPLNYSLILLTVRDWIFICFLIIIFTYDYKYYLILDKITVPAMVVAVIFNIAIALNGLWMFWIIELLAAGIIGGGFFLLQFWVSKGKWIGGGDIRLGVLMGFMLGLPGVLLALFLAYISGAIVGLGLIAAKKKTMKSQIPFGTFLSAASIMVLLYGGPILSWYLNLLR